jgi:hypothetical protein
LPYRATYAPNSLSASLCVKKLKVIKFLAYIILRKHIDAQYDLCAGRYSPEVSMVDGFGGAREHSGALSIGVQPRRESFLGGKLMHERAM